MSIVAIIMTGVGIFYLAGATLAGIWGVWDTFFR